MGIRRFFRSQKQGSKPPPTSPSKQPANGLGDDNGHDPNKGPKHDPSSLTIPPSIWIDHVFGFLDRQTQNRLCAASKDVFIGVRRLQVRRPWPHGCQFRIKKVVLAVAFAPSGDELTFATANSKLIQVWNRQRGEEQSLEGHRGQCSDVAYGDDFLVSCSRIDGTVRLWKRRQDPVGDRLYWNYRILNVQVFATRFVRVSADSQKIASFGDDGTIYLSNVHDGSLTATTFWRSQLFIDCYACVAFPKRCKDTLAHTFNNQTVRLWNWKTKRRTELEDNDRTRLVDYKAYVASIQFVETGLGTKDVREYLVVGCAVAKVKLWSLEDYTCIRTFHLGSGWSAVTHLVFNDEGTRMACTGDGAQIRVFDVSSGKCLEQLAGHKNKVNTLAFSPDGTTLASGSNDRTMRLFAVP